MSDDEAAGGDLADAIDDRREATLDLREPICGRPESSEGLCAAVWVPGGSEMIRFEPPRLRRSSLNQKRKLENRLLFREVLFVLAPVLAFGLDGPAVAVDVVPEAADEGREILVGVWDDSEDEPGVVAQFSRGRGGVSRVGVGSGEERLRVKRPRAPDDLFDGASPASAADGTDSGEGESAFLTARAEVAR